MFAPIAFRPVEFFARFIFLIAVITIVACGGSGGGGDEGGGDATPVDATVTFSHSGSGAVEVANDAIFLGLVDAGGINSTSARITQLTSPTGDNWLNDDYLSWLTYPAATVSGGIPYNENSVSLGGVWQVAGQASTTLFWKTSEGTKLKVLFVLVSLPIGTDDPALLDIVERFKGIFAVNGLSVTDVAFATLSSNDTYMDETDSNGDENLDGMERLFSVSGNFGDYADYTPIYFVRSIGDGGGILGIAGGIPGPMIHNTSSSGVVINTFGGDLSLLSSDNRQVMGETIAHELGHYLGLYHTTESDGSNFDPIADTPQCPSDNPTASSCPDGPNLMFWAAGVPQSTLSEGQRTVLRRSWYFRP